jgi:hypothetical protein
VGEAEIEKETIMHVNSKAVIAFISHQVDLSLVGD